MNGGVPAQLSGREEGPSRNVRPTFSLNWQLSASDGCLHFSKQSKRKVWEKRTSCFPLTGTKSALKARPCIRACCSFEPREVHTTHPWRLPCPAQGVHLAPAINQTGTSNSPPRQTQFAPLGLWSTGMFKATAGLPPVTILPGKTWQEKKSGGQGFKV